jgi:hypothetical protein
MITPTVVKLQAICATAENLHLINSRYAETLHSKKFLLEPLMLKGTVYHLFLVSLALALIARSAIMKLQVQLTHLIALLLRGLTGSTKVLVTSQQLEELRKVCSKLMAHLKLLN